MRAAGYGVPSPVRGRYLTRNLVANLALRCIDAVLSLYRAFASTPGRSEEFVPKRILVANGAHLGDVVLSTVVLPALARAFPNVKIGMLVGSWSSMVVSGHPLVEWIHIVDHWKLNRSNNTRWVKFVRYLRTRAHALEEIRSIGYCAAIDLYVYFPNAILVLWQAGIPVRVGYTSAAFGPLLTHPVAWTIRDCSVVEYHAELLRQLGVQDSDLQGLQPTSLPIKRSDALTELLPDNGSKYLVLHVGAGLPSKEWPLAKWRNLAEYLGEGGHKLVFTGAGKEEHRKIKEIIRGLPGCRNLCGMLDWQDFVSVISHARLLIGVDSIAGHVAAANQTPCIIIGNGMNNPHWWRPLSSDCVILMQRVPCAPCYLSRGCGGMECVRDVRSEEVILEIDRKLRMKNQMPATSTTHL